MYVCLKDQMSSLLQVSLLLVVCVVASYTTISPASIAAHSTPPAAEREYSRERGAWPGLLFQPYFVLSNSKQKNIKCES